MTVRYDPKFILHLFDYMVWGDRKQLAAARAVPDAEYNKHRGFSAGSIHDVLVHQMAAQKGWLSRWNGVNPTRIEDRNDYPTRAALEQRWPIVHRELLDFVSRQTEQSLAAVMHVRRTNGDPVDLPLGAQMMHVSDHGTYHRGQLNSMLKLAGAATVYTPYYRYVQATETRQP